MIINCFTFVSAHMNSSGSTATPLINGSGKFTENSNKYEAPSVSGENALLEQQKQQYQQQPMQQQPQSQYQQQGFVEGFSNGSTTQLRRTQSIISQSLRDQQYQLYCSSSSPPLQQQQQLQQRPHQQLQPVQQQQYVGTAVSQLQQHPVNNAYGMAEDAVMYGSGGVGVGLANIARQQQQQQQQQVMAVGQQRQQQYSMTNNLQAETNYTSSGTGNTTIALQQPYNKRDGNGYDSNTSGSARFDSQPQTYQQQQEVLYQPYQPEYATYQQQPQQQQQQNPYNQLPQQQQKAQQQYQQQPFQQGQPPQFQRFPNQDQQQQQSAMGDNSQQYIMGSQQKEDNSITQNAIGLTQNGGIKYNTNDVMVVEPSSTSLRPLQQQLVQVSIKY
jgi:hypothetical protein